MFTPRRNPRLRLTRFATIWASVGDDPPRTLDARTLDLSAEGAGLLTSMPLPEGVSVVLTIEDRPRGLLRRRQWAGRVVHARGVRRGAHVGIAFAENEGPSERFHLPTAAAAERIVRRDPAWGEARPPEKTTAPEALRVRTGPAQVALAVATLGLLVDQGIKSLRAAPALRPSAAMVKNFGALGGFSLGDRLNHQALALVGLLLAGIGLRLGLAGRRRPSPAEVVGWGCLLAGLFGNTVDRLALGYVRDVLRSDYLPRWVFNPADALALAGATALLVSWLVPRRSRVVSAPTPALSSLPVAQLDR